MTRFNKAFGEKYENAVSQIRTRTFTFGGYEFKVRLQLSAETEAMYKRIAEIDDTELQARVLKMTAALRESPPEGVEITDTDVIVNGRSTREVAMSIMLMEQRITEHFRLLVPVEGTLDDLTYAEIEAEFPLPTQLEMLETILDVVQPGYKDARKNS